MTPEDRDDILIAIYIQLSRIYDLLLIGPDGDKKALIELHKQGKTIGPAPSLTEDEDTE